MVFTEFLGLVIAIILLFFISSIFFKYCDLYAKQRYDDSYNELVTKIEDFENSDLGKTSTDLIMEDNKYIAFFSKDANEIGLYRTREDLEGDIKRVTIYYTLKKPDNEECKDKACSCFCKNVEESNVILGEKGREQEIFCKKQICHSSNLDFLDEYKGSKGGMVIDRNVFYRFEKIPKLRTIYIEKDENDKIVVCTRSPCVENE